MSGPRRVPVENHWKTFAAWKIRRDNPRRTLDPDVVHLVVVATAIVGYSAWAFAFVGAL